MDDEGTALPLGPSGRLEAVPLSNAAGDHALLIRQGDATRALLTGEHGTGRERVILIPLDEDIETRVDGDALAIWLARGSVAPVRAQVPAWANALGFALVLAVIGLAILGSLTFFAWLTGLLT